MKIAGLFIIFISCSCAGIVKSFEYAKSCDELYSFLLLLKHIKREITLYLTLQSEIFNSFENKTLEKKGLLKELRLQKITDDKSVLFHALKSEEKNLTISKEAKRVLFEFSEDFGQNSSKEQIEKCNIAIGALEELYKKEKEDADARVKISRSLGVMTGIAAVLLLM